MTDPASAPDLPPPAPAPRRRPRRRAIALAIVLGLAAAAAVGWRVLSRHPLPDGWGEPLVRERFETAAWRERWVADGDNAWEVRDGGIVSAAPARALLIFRQRLTPPVAVEYTGRIPAGARPGDLSVWWSEREGVLADPTTFEKDARSWQIQAGAYENSYCAIFRHPGGQRLAYDPRQVEAGRDHRFRVEIDGEWLSLRIDGVEVLRSRDRFPTTSGHLALFGYYPGKTFRDIAIWQKPSAGTVPAVAAGDALMSFGHFQDAATLYSRLAEGGGEMAQQALFRKGVAERRLDRRDLARESWSRLTDPALARVADALRLEDLSLTGQHDLFLDRFDAWWRERPEVRDDLRQQWQLAVSRLAAQREPEEAVLARLLALRARLFADDRATGFETTQALLALRRYDEVLAGFPGEGRACVRALKGLGRNDEVRRLPRLLPEDRVDLATATGDFALVVDDPTTWAYFRSFALCKLGRAAEIREPQFQIHPGMLYLGKAAELAAIRPISPGIAREALIACGRLDEAAGAGLPDLPGSGGDGLALAVLGRLDEAEKVLGHPLPWARLIAACETGDRAAVARLRPLVQPPRDLMGSSGWVAGVLIGPLVDRSLGDAGALRAALKIPAERWGQVFAKRAFLVARHALGQCDEAAVRTMPALSEGEAWALVARAVKAEVEDRPGDAAAAWRAYLALPMDRRLLGQNTIDPEVECLARWRVRALDR